jgi:hypothetical protein
MPTLKAVLEEVVNLGPGFLLSDDGAYWLASDVLGRLEQDAPERLTYSVSWVEPEDMEEGAIYASDDTEAVLSPIPLYRVHRQSRALPPDDAPIQ